MPAITMLRAASPFVVDAFIRQSSTMPVVRHDRPENGVPPVAAGARDELPGEHRGRRPRRASAASARLPTTSPRCRSRPARRAGRRRSSRTSPCRRAPCRRRSPATIGLRRISKGRIGSADTPLDEREEAEQHDRMPPARRRRGRSSTGSPCRPRRARAGARPCRARAGPRRASRSCARETAARRRGMVTEMTTSATPPTGRLTRKTQRQLALSTMKPPTAGPMIDDAAKTAPISPCQRPRSRGGTMLPITASESGKSPPAPMPCTARKRTSCVIDVAAPQSSRAEQEDDDREQEEVLPPVDVAELAVQRHRDGRGEHVRREDPRVLRDPAEVADDLRQRRRHDRLIERGEQQRHHQARVDREDPPDREVVAGRLAPESLAEAHGEKVNDVKHLTAGRLGRQAP